MGNELLAEAYELLRGTDIFLSENDIVSSYQSKIKSLLDRIDKASPKIEYDNYNLVIKDILHYLYWYTSCDKATLNKVIRWKNVDILRSLSTLHGKVEIINGCYYLTPDYRQFLCYNVYHLQDSE